MRVYLSIIVFIVLYCSAFSALPGPGPCILNGKDYSGLYGIGDLYTY